MSTRVLKAVRSAVLAVALAALVGTTSGQVKPSVKALTLTPMDYIEIRQLVNRYAFALHTGSNNGYGYADLFAADGELMRPYAKGREQLAALARGPRLGPDNTVQYIMNQFAGANMWDLASDGKRVLVVTPAQSAAEAPKAEHEVVFLENFFDELRRRAPVGR